MKLLVLLSLCAFLFSNNINAHRTRAALYTTNELDPQLIQAIKAKAKEIYDIKVVFMGTMEYPHKGSNGYAAEAFTEKLESKRGRKEYAIGLTDQDIIRTGFFDWDFSFTVDTILGYTDIPQSSCIISSAELKDSNTFNRTVNVVMHELGHCVGLEHCDDENCLMIAYDQLDNDSLCWKCKEILEKFKQQ